MSEEVKQASLAECNAQLFASMLAAPEAPAAPEPKPRKAKAEPTEQPASE
jgi:hypothetical protein